MSRPSPQEQARDCRACVYWRAESEHIVSTCSARSIAVKGHETCCDFRPAPPRPPASPPVSADREGPDAIETMYQVNGVLALARSWAKTHAPMQVALVESTIAKFCDLITAEEARRARPECNGVVVHSEHSICPRCDER